MVPNPDILPECPTIGVVKELIDLKEKSLKGIDAFLRNTWVCRLIDQGFDLAVHCFPALSLGVPGPRSEYTPD